MRAENPNIAVMNKFWLVNLLKLTFQEAGYGQYVCMTMDKRKKQNKNKQYNLLYGIYFKNS